MTATQSVKTEKTHCECPFHGWCERHHVNKSIRMHEVCQTKPKYFDAWEEGRGPGQAVAQERKDTVVGPGTVLSRELRNRGYTEFVGCGCQSKIVKMNVWGTEKCRANLDEIVGWLEEAAKKRGWKEKVALAVPGLKTYARWQIRNIVIESLNICDKLADKSTLVGNERTEVKEAE